MACGAKKQAMRRGLLDDLRGPEKCQLPTTEARPRVQRRCEDM